MATNIQNIYKPSDFSYPLQFNSVSSRLYKYSNFEKIMTGNIFQTKIKRPLYLTTWVALQRLDGVGKCVTFRGPAPTTGFNGLVLFVDFLPCALINFSWKRRCNLVVMTLGIEMGHVHLHFEYRCLIDKWQMSPWPIALDLIRATVNEILLDIIVVWSSHHFP